jgi:hypothetical protein
MRGTPIALVVPAEPINPYVKAMISRLLSDEGPAKRNHTYSAQLERLVPGTRGRIMNNPRFVPVERNSARTNVSLRLFQKANDEK